MFDRDMCYMYLAIKYPVLKGFFQSCYAEKEDDKLLDFLFAIETNDVVTYY